MFQEENYLLLITYCSLLIQYHYKREVYYEKTVQVKRPVHSLLSQKKQQKSAPCYFCRAPCSQLNISRESAMLKHFVRSIKKVTTGTFPKQLFHGAPFIEYFQNALLRQIVPGTDKIYEEDFLKVAVFKCSTKEAVSSSFGTAPCT